jgi:hypothetical protein
MRLVYLGAWAGVQVWEILYFAWSEKLWGVWRLYHRCEVCIGLSIADTKMVSICL